MQRRPWTWVLVVAVSFLALGSGGGELRRAGAEAPPAIHEQVMDLVAPGPDGPQYGRITFFALEEPGVDWDRRLLEGKRAMLARFPGAVELEDAGVSGQFRVFGVRWPQPSASWWYSPAGSTPAMDAKAAEEAVTLGAAGWDNAGGSGFHFNYLGDTTTATGCNGDTTIYVKDGKNVVGWGHIAGGYLGYSCFWRGTAPVPATPYFTTEEFDIVFEPDFAYSAGSLRALAMHEFGHALGLDHTETGLCPGQAMCAGNDALTFISPRPDDITGVIALYGGSLPPVVPPGPRPYRATGVLVARD